MRSLILVAACSLALTGCTTVEKERVGNTTAAICASIPLAQAAYNAAARNGGSVAANVVLSTLTAFCPSILAGITLVPERLPVSTVDVPESISPAERG